jgi:hypothetical protein
VNLGARGPFPASGPGIAHPRAMDIVQPREPVGNPLHARRRFGCDLAHYRIGEVDHALHIMDEGHRFDLIGEEIPTQAYRLGPERRRARCYEEVPERSELFARKFFRTP